MILLKNKPQTHPVSPQYPYGDIKDDTGAEDGTPIDRLVYADLHQLTERMFAKSGIAPNNLPDNATNGFQLYEALIKTIVPDPIDLKQYATSSATGFAEARIVGKKVSLFFSLKNLGGVTDGFMAIPLGIIPEPKAILYYPCVVNLSYVKTFYIYKSGSHLQFIGDSPNEIDFSIEYYSN